MSDTERFDLEFKPMGGDTFAERQARAEQNLEAFLKVSKEFPGLPMEAADWITKHPNATLAEIQEFCKTVHIDSGTGSREDWGL